MRGTWEDRKGKREVGTLPVSWDVSGQVFFWRFEPHIYAVVKRSLKVLKCPPPLLSCGHSWTYTETGFQSLSDIHEEL